MGLEPGPPLIGQVSSGRILPSPCTQPFWTKAVTQPTKAGQVVQRKTLLGAAGWCSVPKAAGLLKKARTSNWFCPTLWNVVYYKASMMRLVTLVEIKPLTLQYLQHFCWLGMGKDVGKHIANWGNLQIHPWSQSLPVYQWNCWPLTY